MQNAVPMQVIAHIRSDFPSKFGIPRQSGLVDALKAEIIFEPPYRNPDAFRGLEGYSHIWLIWQFSQAIRDHWSPTVRPPRLGGNTRMGVFATRSPFRPNHIGLSCVRLEKVAHWRFLSPHSCGTRFPPHSKKRFLPCWHRIPALRISISQTGYMACRMLILKCVLP